MTIKGLGQSKFDRRSLTIPTREAECVHVDEPILLRGVWPFRVGDETLALDPA
jgi:hypothetical protein